jgi:dTDP-4-amino-4,6-dideoxygalactose transaminase
VGVARCVSLGNGSDALELACAHWALEAGDHVMCTANAGFYSSTAIRLVGAIPHYVEIDNILQTMSPDALAQALDTATVKPRALIVTHLYGQLADIEALCEIAARHDVPVIEDCAQSHGARRNGRQCGTFGALAAFRFLSDQEPRRARRRRCGVVTNDAAIADRVARLRQYGWSAKVPRRNTAWPQQPPRRTAGRAAARQAAAPGCVECAPPSRRRALQRRVRRPRCHLPGVGGRGLRRAPVRTARR